MSDIGYGLLSQLVALPCPRCSYVVEVQLLDLHTQTYRRCPCCYSMLHLVDNSGSVYGAIENIKNSIRGLFR